MSGVGVPAVVDHSGFYRGLLVFGSLAIPVFGLVEWGIGYNPFGVRLGLGAAGLLLYAASYRSEALRRNLRVVVLLFCHVLLLWFSYIAYRHNMTANDVIGLLPIVIGIAVVIRRPAELVASITFMVIVLTISYQQLEAPVLGLSATVAVLSTFAAVLGSMSVWRTRLEEELQIANTTLEERVRERTARLEREVEERARAEERANAANEAKSRFLANMSHELRTPLNAVIGYTDLVEEELQSTGEAHLCEDLGRVGSAATHLLAIIDDILDLSQIESGRLEIRREPVKLRAAVDDALLLVKPALALHQNRLLVDVSEALVVAGEHGPIVRVLVHLLDNAAKFTREGEVEVRAERSGEWVDLAVRDSGIGIPEEARAELFDRFTQADTSAARVHDGLGLGLAICRELVERLGGRSRSRALSVRGASSPSASGSPRRRARERPRTRLCPRRSCDPPSLALGPGAAAFGLSREGRRRLRESTQELHGGLWPAGAGEERATRRERAVPRLGQLRSPRIMSKRWRDLD